MNQEVQDVPENEVPLEYVGIFRKFYIPSEVFATIHQLGLKINSVWRECDDLYMSIDAKPKDGETMSTLYGFVLE